MSVLTWIIICLLLVSIIVGSIYFINKGKTKGLKSQPLMTNSATCGICNINEMCCQDGICRKICPLFCHDASMCSVPEPICHNGQCVSCQAIGGLCTANQLCMNDGSCRDCPSGQVNIGGICCNSGKTNCQGTCCDLCCNNSCCNGTGSFCVPWGCAPPIISDIPSGSWVPDASWKAGVKQIHISAYPCSESAGGSADWNILFYNNSNSIISTDVGLDLAPGQSTSLQLNRTYDIILADGTSFPALWFDPNLCIIYLQTPYGVQWRLVIRGVHIPGPNSTTIIDRTKTFISVETGQN